MLTLPAHLRRRTRTRGLQALLVVPEATISMHPKHVRMKFWVAHGRLPRVPKFVLRMDDYSKVQMDWGYQQHQISKSEGKFCNQCHLRKSAPPLSTVHCFMPRTLPNENCHLRKCASLPPQRSRRVCCAAAARPLVPEATQTLKETPAAHGRQKIETPVSRITFAL